MKTRTLLLALLPLGLLALLLFWIVRTRPADALRGDVPATEVLAFTRVTLGPNEVRLTVINDGPDPLTVAQVMVDDAYWSFTQTPPGELGHLGRAELVLPYPWVSGETHLVKVVTRNGITFEHEIAVALNTPRPTLRAAWLFALLGIYVGVVPVALGLLWYPVVGKLGPRAMDFLLALTLGLLLFLLVDALHEARELADTLPGAFQGAALLVLGFAGAYLALEALGAWLGRRGGGDAAWITALLVACGIGLHNFGEGLAIGAALAIGEAALGTLLVVGFTLHNTTEGLAIVAPLARQRTSWRRLLWLGVIGGVPTIAGAWLGGFVYSPVFSALFLALGAGAIAQVIVQIARGVAGSRPIGEYLRSAPVAAGLVGGFLLMYATGMLIQ